MKNTLLIFILGLFIASCSQQPEERQITFRPLSLTSTWDLVSIQKFYLDLESGIIEPQDISISEVDINNDGLMDRIVRAKNSNYCGASGCLHGVLIRNNKTFEEANTFFVHDFKLLTSTHNQFSDILLNNERLWVWNPKQEKYQLLEN